MKSYRKDGKIIIEIEEKNILNGCQYMEGPVKVTNEETFLNFVSGHFMHYGDNGDRNSCSDLSKLLDGIVTDAAMRDFGATIEEQSK